MELFCDEVAIIRLGKVALAGPLAELTAGNGYRVSAATPSNGPVQLHLPNRLALNEAIDRLRAEGAEIEAVNRVRSTLEDVFVRTVEDPQ